MGPAYIGMGANVGDARGAIQAAHAALAELPGAAGARLSSLWRTAPVGFLDQADFVNAVCALAFSTPPDPAVLLDTLLGLERAAGRDRMRETPGGPRTLDLDLLLWDDRVVRAGGLILPHPRLHQRAFVLAPLVEVAGPDLVVPGHGRAGDLLARVLADPAQRVMQI